MQPGGHRFDPGQLHQFVGDRGNLDGYSRWCETHHADRAICFCYRRPRGFSCVAGRVFWRCNTQRYVDIYSTDGRWRSNNGRRHDFGSNRKISVMLGVKCDNRESVHGPMKVVLTPNIGLDVLQWKYSTWSSLSRMRKLVANSHTRSGGACWCGDGALPRNAARTNFDN